MAAPETPNSRKETYYDSILKDGDTGLTPNSREEMYLDAIDRDLDGIRAEVDKKSESIRLEYKNNKIYQGETEIDFEGIKALMGDHTNEIDLHADNDTIMRITAFADDAIEFSTTYITGGKVYVDRVIINSDNDIKFDEIELGGGGGTTQDSTTPHIVGKTVDGKDIYEVTLTGTYTPKAGYTTISAPAIAGKRVMSMTGTIKVATSTSNKYDYIPAGVSIYNSSGTLSAASYVWVTEDAASATYFRIYSYAACQGDGEYYVTFRYISK